MVRGLGSLFHFDLECDKKAVWPSVALTSRMLP